MIMENQTLPLFEGQIVGRDGKGQCKVFIPTSKYSDDHYPGGIIQVDSMTVGEVDSIIKEDSEGIEISLNEFYEFESYRDDIGWKGKNEHIEAYIDVVDDVAYDVKADMARKLYVHDRHGNGLLCGEVIHLELHASGKNVLRLKALKVMMSLD